MMIQNRHFIRRLAIVLLAVLAPVGTNTSGGTFNVQGSLNVASNLTAQSVTLGGTTQTNWPAGLAQGYQGYQYVIVAEGTNDQQRGSNLQAAYSAAAALSPNVNNRVAVLVPPGAYDLGSAGLVMNTSYVDLIGLVPAQMTSKAVFTDITGRTRTKTISNVQCAVLIYANAADGAVVQNVDYVRIESVILNNTGSGLAYNPSVFGTNTALRHVSMSSMAQIAYAGQYIDCVGGDNSFGGMGSDATGTFIDCVAGANSFAGAANGGNASGTFIDCTAGDESFAGTMGDDHESGGSASGTFRGCVAGDNSFGADGTASGTFINCVSGVAGFAGNEGYTDVSPYAPGTFVDCVAGYFSFGSQGTAAGTFRNCVAGSGSFGGYGVASGEFTDCVGGWNSFGGRYIASGKFTRCTGGGGCFGSWGTTSGIFIDCTDGDYGFGAWGTGVTTAKMRHCKATAQSFLAFLTASDDFNYNVSGTNTFLMLPQLPTSTNGLPSGTVYNSGGSLKVMP